MSKWEYPEITVDEFYQGGLEAVDRKTRGALQRIDVYLGLYQDWSIWEDYPAEYGRSEYRQRIMLCPDGQGCIDRIYADGTREVSCGLIVG